MPRTPTKPTVKVEARPYPSSSPPSNDSDSRDDGSAKKKKLDRKGSKGSVWTGEEQLQLFHFAMNRNGRSWGDAVPGKSGVQACSLWTWVFYLLMIERAHEDSKRLLPYIEKAVVDRGKWRRLDNVILP
jgi:hypothetical protein